jgi:hypothetical protein
MRGDLPGRHSFRIQRQDDLVDLGQPALPFLHDLRLERPFPIAGNIDRHFTGRVRHHRFRSGTVSHVRRLAALIGLVLLVTEMLGQLLVQRCLENILREQLQQPIRAGQLQAALPRLGHHRGRRSLLRRQPQALGAGFLPWTHDP